MRNLLAKSNPFQRSPGSGILATAPGEESGQKYGERSPEIGGRSPESGGSQTADDVLPAFFAVLGQPAWEHRWISFHSVSFPFVSET